MNKANKSKEYCIEKFKKYKGKLGKKLLIQMMLSIEKKAIQIQQKKEEFNLEPLLIGIHFHDLGRVISDGDDHPELSYKLFLEFKKEEKYSAQELEIIKDCCLNHGSKATPITEEGKLLQILDKSIVFEPEIIVIVLEKIMEKEGSWKKGYEQFIIKMNKWHNKIPDKKTKERLQQTLDYLNQL
ncbi:MAG: HD domain-containing protein [bacterium]|nr:HD domain-containing protein [bacterium]